MVLYSKKFTVSTQFAALFMKVGIYYWECDWQKGGIFVRRENVLNADVDDLIFEGEESRPSDR